MDASQPQITVAIWHNVAIPDNFLSGWKPEHPMVKVFTYEIPGEQARTPEAVLEEAFVTFNVGEDSRAGAYRLAGNRSLSKGDVVAIGELAWACASRGWEQIVGTIAVCDRPEQFRAYGSMPWTG